MLDNNKKKIIISVILLIIIAISFTIYIITENKNNNILDLEKEAVIENVNDVENKTEETVENVNNKVNNNILEEELVEIAIHITGEVKNQGLIYLKEGARIADAIKKAGGETKNADLSQVNLAYRLQDGQKIYIPNKNEKIMQYISENKGNNDTEEKNASNSNKEDKKVNINTATQSELDGLPGIGPSIAQKIVDYREKNGKFKSIEELQNVKGIGDAKYEDIKNNVTV